MAVSKATVLNALKLFKGLQDSANANKFVAQEDGKGLISSADQNKLDGIASGAQINIIEAVKVNGTALTPTNKAVNIDLSAYVKGTDVASALTYKSTVNSFANLPASGQKIGDVYGIKTAGGTDADGMAIKAGDNVFWNGSGWDLFAGSVDLSGYVEKETGKGLSSNDFTDALKTKLEDINAEGTTEETITEAEVQAIFNA